MLRKQTSENKAGFCAQKLYQSTDEGFQDFVIMPCLLLAYFVILIPVSIGILTVCKSAVKSNSEKKLYEPQSPFRCPTDLRGAPPHGPKFCPFRAILDPPNTERVLQAISTNFVPPPPNSLKMKNIWLVGRTNVPSQFIQCISKE